MQLGACWPVLRYVILLFVFNCMLWLFNFREDQIFVDFVGFLSMIIYIYIYIYIYAQCLRFNICSAWLLDIRISTC